MYSKYLKPVFDFLLSLITLIILSPIFIILIIILSIINNGRPFYTQYRPGKNGKEFNLIKFKTMNDNTDERGQLLPDNDRITSFGKFIRSASIDELPQLLNILKGEMSFIGPRPLLKEYLPLYDANQRRRHNVKPGISGWAQVNGRNTISWKDKFKYDVWYVDNISLWLDIKIFLMTIIKVIFREGINNSKQNTMDIFKGSK